MKRFTLLLLLLCTLVGIAGAQEGRRNIKSIDSVPSITIDTTDLDIGMLDVKQNTTFAGTSGTAWNWQILILEIGASAVYTLTWNPNVFKETFLPLPTKTVVLPKKLMIGLKYNALAKTWEILSSNVSQ